jgi:hypothetical protein
MNPGFDWAAAATVISNNARIALAKYTAAS